MVRRIPGPVLRGRAQPIKGYAAAALLTDILGVNVDAGFSVVNQVPIWMVRIVIDNDVVGASPAPVSGIFPIPRRDFKTESTVKPEAMETEVKSGEAIGVRRTEIREPAMLVGSIQVEPRIVTVGVAIPMIIANVRPFVYFAALISMYVSLAALGPGGRRWRNVATVSAMLLITALRKRARSHYEKQNKKETEEFLHRFLQFKKHLKLSNERGNYPID